MSDLFQLGEFKLSSGATSRWKIECDAWTDGDVQCLAEMIRQLAGPFSAVEGVPTGGLRLAEALRPFCSLSGPYLLVDDVLTTGGSLMRLRDERINGETLVNPLPLHPMLKGHLWIVACVVFARGQCPTWVRAVFQMPECFWTKPRTRGGIKP